MYFEKGDKVCCKYGFRLDSYNIDAGLADISIFVEEPTRSDQVDGGLIKRTELVVVPLNLPVFGLGINYKDNYVHPVSSHQSDLVWVDKSKNICYDKSTRRRLKVIVDEFFQVNGEYIVMPLDSPGTAEKRKSIKRSKDQLSVHINALKGKVFSGELLNGKVTVITTMDRALNIKVLESIDTSLMSKRLANNHITVTVWIENENRMEFSFPADLLTRM